MRQRETPLYWSFSLGEWFRTRIQVSVFFPLIVLVFCVRLYHPAVGIKVGLAASAILFVTVLIHEFGHVMAARMTGGSADEILIWPLGGLAMTRPADDLRARLLTITAGPLTNLILCTLSAFAVYRTGDYSAALDPFTMPFVMLTENVFFDLMLLVFSLNWALLLVNLLPIYPLDGGQVLETVLTARAGGEKGTQLYIKIGIVIAILVMVAGLLMDHTALLFVGSVVLVLNFWESSRRQNMDQYDESFMGYDFSQGYTSLEREEPQPSAVGPVKKLGPLARWRERRRKLREAQERVQETEISQQLDVILEKVHQNGIESLSKDEQQILHRASQRFRKH